MDDDPLYYENNQCVVRLNLYHLMVDRIESFNSHTHLGMICQVIYTPPTTSSTTTQSTSTTESTTTVGPTKLLWTQISLEKHVRIVMQDISYNDAKVQCENLVSLFTISRIVQKNDYIVSYITYIFETILIARFFPTSQTYINRNATVFELENCVDVYSIINLLNMTGNTELLWIELTQNDTGII